MLPVSDFLSNEIVYYQEHDTSKTVDTGFTENWASISADYILPLCVRL